MYFHTNKHTPTLAYTNTQNTDRWGGTPLKDAVVAGHTLVAERCVCVGVGLGAKGGLRLHGGKIVDVTVLCTCAGSRHVHCG